MAVLCVLLSVVCLTGYRRSDIADRIILLIFLYGLWYRYWDAGGCGLTDYLIICCIVYLIFWPFFKIGALGSGDIRIFSVTSGFLSGRAAVRCLLISLLIAAMISLLRICIERNARERAAYLCSYLAGVCKNGYWSLYLSNLPDSGRREGYMACPVLFSVLLHAGGVY